LAVGAYIINQHAVIALVGDVDTVWYELIFFHFISFVSSEYHGCGSLQPSGLLRAVKHKANLSLDVIFACKNSARVIQPVARLRETLTG